MLMNLYSQLVVMSVIAGGLFLILKLFSAATMKYFTPFWHYCTYTVIYMFFLLPYHKFVSLFSFSKNVKNGVPLPVLSSITRLPSANNNDFVTMADKTEGISKINLDFLPYFFIAGTLVFIIVILIQNFILHHRIFGVCRLTDEAQFQDVLSKCKEEMGISNHVWVYISPYISTPFLYGILKPRIVLPDIKFTTEELRYVFQHELTHWKRHDAWLKCLILIVNAVHWFNPLAYIARRNIDNFCELSCDESVVSSMNNEERRRYCELMLDVLWNVTGHNVKLFSAFSDKREQLERRINIIMKMSDLKSKKWVRMLGIAVTLTFVLGGAITVYATTDVPEQGLVAYNDSSLQLQAIQPVNFAEINQIALPEDSTTVELESINAGDTGSSITPFAVFTVSTTDLEPGYYTRSSSYYYVEGGTDELGYDVVWSPAGNDIKIGLIPIDDDSTQYVTTLSGGSGSGTLSTSNVPDGDYYVVIINPSSNSSDISSVTGNFEWE